MRPINGMFTAFIKSYKQDFYDKKKAQNSYKKQIIIKDYNKNCLKDYMRTRNV